MKILYHHRVRSRDGQAVHLEALIDAMRGLGHDVLLVGPTDFACASFGYEPKLLAQLKRFTPKMIFELMELCYNIPAYIRLYHAVMNFQPDLIYERYSLYLLAGIWTKFRMRVPLLLEVNAPLARERASFGGLGLQKIARRLERWVWRGADFVLPVTGVLGDEIAAAGVPSDRINVIPNAIDPVTFGQFDLSIGAKEKLTLAGKLVLGFTGFVRDWHGLDTVIDLISRTDPSANTHFLVVGEGPALPLLKTQAKTLGVADRVTFTGLVDRDLIAGYLAAFDIALLPKCVDYCSPLKLFEYMALGKAIVAPNQPNIREILMDGASGLLFEPDSPGSMALAIQRLVQDVELRRKLGNTAQSLVISRGYTWLQNAERVTAIARQSLLPGA